jgi:RNAse (barnase) inhibitor barstar
MASEPGYALTGDDGDRWGDVQEIDGLFEGPPGQPRQVELRGCRPQGGLRTAIARIGTDRAVAGDAHLAFLDTAGRIVGSYVVGGVTVEAVRHAAEPDLVDLTVRLSADLALPGADRTWQVIRAGALDRTGQWHELDEEGKRGWLSVALVRRVSGTGTDQPSGATYQLDGRFVTDEDAFYCAMGEAINGPGGYFGWNLDALNDCLGGGFGARTPFTLNWHSFATARAVPVLDTILEILTRNDVTINTSPGL